MSGPFCSILQKGLESAVIELNSQSDLSETTGMKGALWRLLLADYHNTILPSADQTRQEQVELLLETLAEIVWISYTEPSAQKLRGLRLRLHVLAFTFASQFEQLYASCNITEGLLYLHKMITHYGPFFECCDFRDASAEAGEIYQLCIHISLGEAFITVLKHILLYFTNRKEHHALKEVLIRLHFYKLVHKKDWSKKIHDEWKVILIQIIHSKIL